MQALYTSTLLFTDVFGLHAASKGEQTFTSKELLAKNGTLIILEEVNRFIHNC